MVNSLYFYQPMSFYILFFALSPWEEGVRECLCGNQPSKPDQPTEGCRVTWKKLPPLEKLHSCFSPLYEAVVELTESESRIHSWMQRKILHVHQLAKEKTTQESKRNINVIIWQNLLKLIITLPFNCKHSYYCHSCNSEQLTEEVQSSCHHSMKSILY